MAQITSWAQRWKIQQWNAQGDKPCVGDVLEIANNWEGPVGDPWDVEKATCWLQVRVGELVTVLGADRGYLYGRRADGKTGWIGGPGCFARIVLRVPLGPAIDHVAEVINGPKTNEVARASSLNVTKRMARKHRCRWHMRRCCHCGRRNRCPYRVIVIIKQKAIVSRSQATSGGRVASSFSAKERIPLAGRDCTGKQKSGQDGQCFHIFIPRLPVGVVGNEEARKLGEYLAQFFSEYRDLLGFGGDISACSGSSPSVVDLCVADGGTLIAKVELMRCSKAPIQGRGFCRMCSTLPLAATEVVEYFYEWSLMMPFTYSNGCALLSYTVVLSIEEVGAEEVGAEDSEQVARASRSETKWLRQVSHDHEAQSYKMMVQAQGDSELPVSEHEICDVDVRPTSPKKSGWRIRKKPSSQSVARAGMKPQSSHPKGGPERSRSCSPRFVHSISGDREDDKVSREFAELSPVFALKSVVKPKSKSKGDRGASPKEKARGRPKRPSQNTKETAMATSFWDPESSLEPDVGESRAGRPVYVRQPSPHDNSFSM